MRRPIWWALAATAATAATACVAVGDVGLMAVSFGPGDAVYAAVSLAVSSCGLVLGWLVLRHAPGNAVGAVLCLMGMTPAVMAFADLYPAVLLRRPGSLPVSDAMVTFSAGTWMWLYVAPCLLLLLFPTGRLPSPRWRPVLVAILAVPVAFMVLTAEDPTPFAPPFEASRHVLGTASGRLADVLGLVAVLLLAGLLGLLIASSAAAIGRYRRAHDDRERRQLSWLALASLCLPATLLLCWTSYLLLGSADLVVVGLAVTWLAMPVATWVAITRHDLFDVDRLTSAAVAYALIATVVLLAYTGASIVAGVVVGGSNPVVAAGVAAAVAVGLMTVRPRILTVVDRLAYPARARVASAVHALIAAVHAGEARPEDVQQTLRAALGEPDLIVEHLLVDTETAAGPTARASAVRDGPIDVPTGPGAIARIVGTRHTSRGLLDQVGSLSAPLLVLARLRLDLTASIRETEAARGRLKSAADGERRRLERDLHDGAQQRLVSLGMALRLAQRHLDQDADVDGLLDETVAELATAVGELRELAHGVRPTGLDEGLAAALSTHVAGSTIPVSVRVRTGEVRDEVLTAAYFIVTEAVANAMKHSGGSTIGVDVSRVGDELHIAVRDDGRGGADPAGSGLAGLADRVSVLGGRLSLMSRPSRGTVLEAVLPCDS